MNLILGVAACQGLRLSPAVRVRSTASMLDCVSNVGSPSSRGKGQNSRCGRGKQLTGGTGTNALGVVPNFPFLSMWWIQPMGNCRPVWAAGRAGDRLASIAAGQDASVGDPGAQMGTTEDGMKGGVC